MKLSDKLKNKLELHKTRLFKTGLARLFAEDEQRFNRFSAQCGDLFLDFSKNHIDDDAFKDLLSIADNVGMHAAINAMFDGDVINNTENRQVLHTALRAPEAAMPTNIPTGDVLETRERMCLLADQLASGALKGYTGKPIDTIVNIGVGGSDLGPNMAVNALEAYHQSPARFFFVSNIDPVHIQQCLSRCDPTTTLFIICSKTFTTLETLANAHAARDWFLQHTEGDQRPIAKHFMAVSTNLEAAAEFGIPAANLFPMWDWVGGRYSLWSAIGLTIALALGREQFEAFLAGGHAMDSHFRSQPADANLPIILALLGYWYGGFFDAQSQALICYDQNLEQFPDYLQQLDMESNGKSVTKDGDAVRGQTGAILWGGVGTNTQHSFHQLIHQGTHLIPVDFIVGLESTRPCADQQTALFSNCLAQSQAMLRGRSKDELIAEMVAAGKPEETAAKLAEHRYVEGNKPSNTLVYPKLTPYILGQLIALYEHKVFAQSVLWNINAFDQWGVELGKQLSKSITRAIKNPAEEQSLDCSTRGLIQRFRSK